MAHSIPRIDCDGGPRGTLVHAYFKARMPLRHAPYGLRARVLGALCDVEQLALQ
jgi:hypothetical protein